MSEAVPEALITSYCGPVLDLHRIDLDDIATALADQTDYEHRWLIDPRTGQVAFWTTDTGIDGDNPVEIDELDLTPIDPLPSHIWYSDMVDFAARLTDRAAGEQLGETLRGRGTFRRFGDRLHQRHPDLIASWHTFQDIRARRRAVEWLLNEHIIDQDAADTFLDAHPDPAVP